MRKEEKEMKEIRIILFTFAVTIMALFTVDNTAYGASYHNCEVHSLGNCVEHNFVYVETVESTCSEKGYDLYTCSNCNAIKRVFKPLLDHKYEEVKRVKPTCTKEGYVLRRCTVCGDEDDESLDKIDHDYKTLKVISKATNKKNGKANLVCKKCGHKENNKTIYKWTIDWPAMMFDENNWVPWTGKPIKFKNFTVEDSKGNIINKKYYTVSYKDNVDLGMATVKVTFKDIYSGSQEHDFCIIVENENENLKIKSLKATKNGFKISWGKLPYNGIVNFYVMYSKSETDLENSSYYDHSSKVKVIKLSKNATGKTVSNLKKGTYYVMYGMTTTKKSYGSVNGKKICDEHYSITKKVTVK